MKYLWLFFIVGLFVGCGATKPIKCGDGNTVFIYRKPLAKTLGQDLTKEQGLRATAFDSLGLELDNKSSVLQIFREHDEATTEFMLALSFAERAFSMSPCDKDNAKRFQELVAKISDARSEIRNQTEELRVFKEERNVTGSSVELLVQKLKHI